MIWVLAFLAPPLVILALAEVDEPKRGKPYYDSIGERRRTERGQGNVRFSLIATNAPTL